MTEYIVRHMPKTVVDFAIKHKISLRQDWNNDYMILENGKVVDMTFQPTVKSALCMMKRYLRHKSNN
jgi:hypothetical protein